MLTDKDFEKHRYCLDPNSESTMSNLEIVVACGVEFINKGYNRTGLVIINEHNQCLFMKEIMPDIIGGAYNYWIPGSNKFRFIKSQGTLYVHSISTTDINSVHKQYGGLDYQFLGITSYFDYSKSVQELLLSRIRCLKDDTWACRFL